jgi:hypothetical protein
MDRLGDGAGLDEEVVGLAREVLPDKAVDGPVDDSLGLRPARAA